MEEWIKKSDAIEVIKRCKDRLQGKGLTYEIMLDMVERIPSADRPQGEWIPCSERLPKIGEHHISEPCLVYCKCGAYTFAELEENIFGQVGWNCERDDDYHEPIGEVVAWMPLPEPWRGADDE